MFGRITTFSESVPVWTISMPLSVSSSPSWWVTMAWEMRERREGERERERGGGSGEGGREGGREGEG